MMNIVITGAFGFVGTNLSKGIKKAGNAHLTAVDVLVPENHFYDDYFLWNQLEKMDWGKTDAIIHLAGKAHDTKNTTEEKTYFEINVGLTQRIFDFFLKSNASKFIFFSSVKAVADRVSGDELTESVEPNPQTAYGKSKLEAEKYILSQTLPPSKKVYIIRPCMIHGPGNKGNLNLLYQIVQKGIPWPLGSFGNNRSFTSIENLVFVIHQILTSDIKPDIYQMADDEPISTNRLIQLIAESGGKKARIWNINKNLIRAIAKMGDPVHFPLNSERLKKLTESYIVSNQKLKKNMGVEKMPLSAEEGMRRTLSAFQ